MWAVLANDLYYPVSALKHLFPVPPVAALGAAIVAVAPQVL